MSPTLPPEAPQIVGREAELEEFSEALRTSMAMRPPAPFLLMVSGAAGMGKTSLFHAFADRARSAGWQAAILNLPEFADLTALERAARDAFDFTGAEHGGATPGLASYLRAQSQHTPLLLILDQFHHEHPVARNFLERILPRLRATDARLFLVIGCRQNDAALLAPLAQRTLTLGKVTVHALRQRLEAIAETLHPPLTADEIDGYTRDHTVKPETAGSLLRVLALARRLE